MNIMDKIKKLRTDITSFIKNEAGAVAVMFGVALPVIVTAVGVSVDMAQVYLVRERLSRAIDAGALAAAAMASDDTQEMEDRVIDYIEANYPPNEIGFAYDIVVDPIGNELHVSGWAILDTSFMSVIGYDTVDVYAEAVVQREVRGLEVVMVLDNTGSMSTNNNIGELKTASTNFVNILFDAAEESDHIRIGMVPYSSSVNVGPYGLGENLTGGFYGTPFVEPPENDVYADYTSSYGPYSNGEYGIDEEDLEYDPSEKGQWHGCVLAHDYPDDTLDHVGPWEMYRYDYNGSTDPWYDNVYDYSPYMTYGDYYNTYYGPNFHCPEQPVVPLGSDRTLLLDAIQDMNAEGFTLGNYGMVWGWRVLSPEFPFTEGSSYNDKQWDKAILMMTDGINTMNHAYTAYGRTDSHSVRPNDQNERFEEICNNIKARDVVVYTVTFYSNVDNETKQYYKNCASDPSKYFDAPSAQDLNDVFVKISRELSNLHLKQ